MEKTQRSPQVDNKWLHAPALLQALIISYLIKPQERGAGKYCPDQHARM